MRKTFPSFYISGFQLFLVYDSFFLQILSFPNWQCLKICFNHNVCHNLFEDLLLSKGFPMSPNAKVICLLTSDNEPINDSVNHSIHSLNSINLWTSLELVLELDSISMLLVEVDETGSLLLSELASDLRFSDSSIWFSSCASHFESSSDSSCCCRSFNSSCSCSISTLEASF